jgi:hypothetical protein
MLSRVSSPILDGAGDIVLHEVGIDRDRRR